MIEALSFGFFALGLLISFVMICCSAYLAVAFWKVFKRLARFEIKIKEKDYREEIIAERIKANEKELQYLRRIKGRVRK